MVSRAVRSDLICRVGGRPRLQQHGGRHPLDHHGSIASDVRHGSNSLRAGVDHQPQLRQLAHRESHVLRDLGGRTRVRRRQGTGEVVQCRGAVAALPDGRRGSR